MFHNIILNSDSYKYSHFNQYPESTTGLFGYIEARGGVDELVFFGLQAIIKEYLTVPITHEMVDQAKLIIEAHGEPFDEKGFRRIVDVHNGYFPVVIKAIEEGSVVPGNTALVTIQSTDPELPWVVTFIETILLRVWYPCSVATISRDIKKLIRESMIRSCDSLEGLPFKLHDFGARGVSSTESSAIGGMAHLVNFQGTDTVLSLVAANKYYNEKMAGFSIPAMEHSTVTSWGKEREEEAYLNMLKHYGKTGGIFAAVSDSYSLYDAISNIWGKSLKDKIIESGVTVVIRPDSGNPVDVVLQSLNLLEEAFGCVVNSKGYKVLNHVRLIQGDGINAKTIKAIMDTMLSANFSIDNIAFGMGGALLQQVNRDTFSFAMKVSSVCLGDRWFGVRKAPITDMRKLSKAGRLTTIETEDGVIKTIDTDTYSSNEGCTELLSTVYMNGKLIKEISFETIRKNASVS